MNISTGRKIVYRAMEEFQVRFEKYFSLYFGAKILVEIKLSQCGMES